MTAIGRTAKGQNKRYITHREHSKSLAATGLQGFSLVREAGLEPLTKIAKTAVNQLLSSACVQIRVQKLRKIVIYTIRNFLGF